MMNPLPAPDPNRCVILCRVSSAEQADHGFGLDAQETACRTFAKANRLEITATFRGDEPSTVLLDERPNGREALDAMLRLGAGVLLLAHRDRLARDPYIAGHAKRAVALLGGRILYVEGGNGDSDADLFMDDIGHAVAAHERRRIVARLKAGRDAKAAKHPDSRAQGGKLPHGYRRDPDGLIEIDPDAAAEVRRIYELCCEGRSVRVIAQTMTAETGRLWRPTVVDRILSRELYKLAKPGRIIDPRQWNAAQRSRASRRKRGPRGEATPGGQTHGIGGPMSNRDPT
jgi:DNA invertase Pin-like site-specific DNA recombinase